MLEDTIELLDRQVAHLGKLADNRFLASLPGFVAALRSDARLAAILADLLDEAKALLADHNAARFALRDEAEDIHQRAMAMGLAQTSHGADGEEKDPYDVAQSQVNSLQWPDLNQTEEQPSDPIGTMLLVLSGWLHPSIVGDLGDTETQRPELFRLRIDLTNAKARVPALQREFLVSATTSPAVAAARLFHASAMLSPEQQPVTVGMSHLEQVALYTRVERGQWADARGALFGRPLTETRVKVERIRNALQLDLALLHEEGRRRIGLQRSRRAIVDRYVARATWHDAHELRRLGRAKDFHEDQFTAHFARYLYDQGLNPLTNAITGPHRPDLLAHTLPWTFYVQAKQYADQTGALKVVRGMRQLWDTLGTLKGTAYEVREAFYVVFRRGGPRLLFPAEPLSSDGVKVHPLLVTIAEAKHNGSRADMPIELRAEDLLPAREGEGNVVSLPRNPKPKVSTKRAVKRTR